MAAYSGGKLYAIGVGPGDPELMTVKAVKILKECDVVITPVAKEGGRSVAYEIAKEYIPAGKEIVVAYFPMCTDKTVVKAAWQETANKAEQYLAKGKSVALLTLGDVALYSTAAYITKIVGAAYPVVLVPGVTSISACACRLGFSLAQDKDALSILSGSDLELMEELIQRKANIVIMKPGKHIPAIKETIRRYHLENCFYAVSNCGMENEQQQRGIALLPDTVDYFSVFFIMPQIRWE